MLKVSKHCAERFAERIMKRDEKLSVNTYIAQNENLINERVNKMYEYGEKIYEGRTREDSNFVHIFLNMPWVLLTDRKEEVAITLFKIEAVSEDSPDDEELNRLFVTTRVDKLKSIKKSLDAAKEEQMRESADYLQEISDNKERIKEMESIIVSLKKRNEGLQQSIDYGNARFLDLEEKYRHTIEEMVGAKILKR